MGFNSLAEELLKGFSASLSGALCGSGNTGGSAFRRIEQFADVRRGGRLSRPTTDRS